MQWNIPNTLTVMRLFAAPGVAIMFLYFQRPLADWFALLLFVSAAITDFFDGYLARLWKQESKFGAMLDPIADKAMVVIALVVIVALSTADKLVMDAEIFNGVMDGSIEDVNGVLNYWTVMNSTWTVGVALLWLAAVLTAVTGWDYFSKARPHLVEPGQ